MKHLKAKLMASVGMLLVAIIMMSTASFAWFTISTSPEVANITANITANGNLEIALGNKFGAIPSDSDVTDSGKNQTWGSLIDLKQAFTDADGNRITLKPIRFSVTGSDLAASLKYPVYGLDGRIATLADLVNYRPTATDTAGYFTDIEGVSFKTVTYTELTNHCTNSDIYAFSVDFWLRTNTTPTDDGTVHVTLASASDRASGSDLSEDGLGSYIRGDNKFKNISIAFRASSTDYLGWFLASRTNVGATDTDIVLKKATNTDTYDRLKFADATSTATDFIPLKQNQAMQVTMYVFLDGDKLTNADAYLELTDISINVQFEIDGLQDAMYGTTKNEKGRLD